LMSEHWGQGLATEMSRSIVTLAFDQLGLSDVVCFTLTTNLASRRVMEKTGFTYERDVIHANLPHVLYHLHGPTRPRDEPGPPSLSGARGSPRG
jgi:[ribosomal protein S5]-alanine N-acetyltransferase